MHSRRYDRHDPIVCCGISGSSSARSCSDIRCIISPARAGRAAHTPRGAGRVFPLAAKLTAPRFRRSMPQTDALRPRKHEDAGDRKSTAEREREKRERKHAKGHKEDRIGYMYAWMEELERRARVLPQTALYPSLISLTMFICFTHAMLCYVAVRCGSCRLSCFWDYCVMGALFVCSSKCLSAGFV